MKKILLYKIIPILTALMLWEVLALAVGYELLFPTPVAVLIKLSDIILDGSFLSVIIYSTVRIFAGFTLALICGFLLALAAGKSKFVEALLSPYMVTIKSVPVASFIILALLWLSYDRLSVFISFLIVLPIIYSNVLTGLKNTDIKILQMAQCYKLSYIKKLIYIYLPNVKPFLISSSSLAIGMAWKSGVAAEVIGIVHGSVGEMLYNSKIYLESASLLAWTVLIIISSIITEKLFAFILKEIFRGIEKL